MNTNELAEQATERAQQTGENIRNKARDLTARATAKAREASVTADYYVHEYAWTSLAVVAVAAGLVGYMIGRRER
jgi:Uncharacterized conserved protein